LKDECAPVATVPDLDLEAFISKRWYVQQQMATKYLPEDTNFCVTARYEKKRRANLKGYTVNVFNRARRADGTERKGDLCAFIPDAKDPARLKVAPCFLPSFTAGDYWIVAYDEAEGYALVSGGQPKIWTADGCRTDSGVNEAGLWIFTRAVYPEPGLVDRVRELARGKGFDVSVLNDVSHDGCTGEGYELTVSSENLQGQDAQVCPRVTTVPDLDLEGFISKRWYVQQQMATKSVPEDATQCVTARYEKKRRPNLQGYTVSVFNRARKTDGTERQGELCAFIPDTSDPARLKVAPCFLPRFTAGSYWVVAYDEAEGYALISGGQPEIWSPSGCRTDSGVNEAGLWIFTRAIYPEPGLVDRVRELARGKGFDLGVLNDVSHDGCTGEGYETGA